MMTPAEIAAQERTHPSKRNQVALIVHAAETLKGWNGGRKHTAHEIAWACAMEPELLDVLRMAAEAIRCKTEEDEKPKAKEELVALASLIRGDCFIANESMQGLTKGELYRVNDITERWAVGSLYRTYFVTYANPHRRPSQVVEIAVSNPQFVQVFKLEGK